MANVKSRRAQSWQKLHFLKAPLKKTDIAKKLVIAIWKQRRTDVLTLAATD